MTDIIFQKIVRKEKKPTATYMSQPVFKGKKKAAFFAYVNYGSYI